jgi:hypothetical protein
MPVHLVVERLDAVERPGLADRNVEKRADDTTHRRNLADVHE